MMYQIKIKLVGQVSGGGWDSIKDSFWDATTGTLTLYGSDKNELANRYQSLTGRRCSPSRIREVDTKPLLSEYRRLRGEYDKLGQLIERLK